MFLNEGWHRWVVLDVRPIGDFAANQTSRSDCNFDFRLGNSAYRKKWRGWIVLNVQPFMLFGCGKSPPKELQINFDFRLGNSAYREKWRGWIVLNVQPFTPFEGYAEFTAYKSKFAL